jgi:hypothetical protein
MVAILSHKRGGREKILRRDSLGLGGVFMNDVGPSITKE